MPTFDRRFAIALVVAAAFFMETLDATIITTALPVIAHDFDMVAAHLSVGVSAYLVALTIFMPISGWAADRFGARRVFSAAVTLFTLSSVLCALSNGVMSFTAARILQGVGGAMMVPVGRLVVLRNTSKSELVTAVAILTWPGLLGPILGPVLGGWIATHWSWRWIFFINVPVGILILTSILLLLRPSKHQTNTKEKFDFRGFTLCGLGFGLFMAGVEAASAGAFSLSVRLSLLVVGLMLLAAAIRHLMYASKPLFSLKALSIQTFRVSARGGSLFRLAIASAPFLLPLMFQLGFGMTAVEAGSLLLWLFVGNLSMKPATTWLMNRFGFRQVLVVNGLLVAAGFAVIAQFTVNTQHWMIAAVLFISGMNRSMQFTALNTISYADITQQHMRDATTLYSVLQRMGRGAGIALVAFMLSVSMWLVDGSQAINPDTQAFQVTLWMLSGLALLSVLDFLTLPRNAGSAILKQTQPANS